MERNERHYIEKYTEFVSEEPLHIIWWNECEAEPTLLATKRFRRLWNEIIDLRQKLERYEQYRAPEDF